MFDVKTQIVFLVICFFFAAVAFALDYDANDFAVEVVSYTQGDGVEYDWIDFNDYNEPQNALGRPTLETTGDMDIGPEISMPVVPVYPAWRSFEVVTIGSGGELILRFNHPVGDDENNPYGIDFIVFGNARWRIAGGGSWGPESNPETVTVGSGFYKEQGIVSVSQTGDPNEPNDWYYFSKGPYADDFAPTASYKWDDVNDVWSDELDPTRPVDPNLTIADFDGNSVAEIINIYDGSASGTGFDLKDLDPNDYAALAVDANTGRRWMQYVKIEDDPCGFGLPEIDAVADVRCCGDYKNPFPVGDLNTDCKVGYEDMALLCYYWLAEISGPNAPAVIADIYEDDFVNFYDWTLMANNWLQCNWECE